MERTLIKFGCSWRKISRKDGCKGVSESAHWGKEVKKMNNNKNMEKKNPKKEVEKNVNREISSKEMEEVTGGVAYQMKGMVRRPRF